MLFHDEDPLSFSVHEFNSLLIRYGSNLQVPHFNNEAKSGVGSNFDILPRVRDLYFGDSLPLLSIIPHDRPEKSDHRHTLHEHIVITSLQYSKMTKNLPGKPCMGHRD